MEHLRCQNCGRTFEIERRMDEPDDWPRFHRCPWCRGVAVENPMRSRAPEGEKDIHELLQKAKPERLAYLLALALPENHHARQEAEAFFEGGDEIADTGPEPEDNEPMIDPSDDPNFP